jgi:hypothetical protein
MEKETVKKFDLEAAFKALDDLETPIAKGLVANRVDLRERFKVKHAHEVLVEDYYDVNDEADLELAQEDREAEVAKAKLARIEKIVDLDAETEDDVLPSYVGKYIMQCPQCMTLFYKEEADIETSEENPDVVNINEICQHCGNSSGYTLVGKVGGVDESEVDNFEAEEVAPEDIDNELNMDFPEEGTEEVDAEGTGEAGEAMEDEDFDLDLDLDLAEEPEEEEEGTNESLHNSKLLAKIKDKNDLQTDIESDHLTLLETLEETDVNESMHNSELLDKIEDKNELKSDIESENLTLIEAADVPTETPEAEQPLNEEKESELGEEAFNSMLDSLWSEEQPTVAETKTALAEFSENLKDNKNFVDIDELDEKSFNEHLTKYMTEVYSNVKDFTATSCNLDKKRLTVEGVIAFKSGKSKQTTFIFESTATGFRGANSDFAGHKAFGLKARIDNKQLITEGITYRYKIGESLVKGTTRKTQK